MNAIIHNQLPSYVAEALSAPSVPVIRAPIAATLNQRIGSLAKKLLDLEREIAVSRYDDRDRWEETATDLDALLHDAEHAAGLLASKLQAAE